jgi:hypothetical protein
VKVVYSAPDEASAQLVCDLLEAHEIPCRMNGTSLVALRGALPMADATVTVEVLNADDVERARTLIAEFERAATSGDEWSCPTCREDNPSNFDSCWKCSQPRSQQPAAEKSSPPAEAAAAAEPSNAPVAPAAIRSADMLLVLLLGCAGSAGFIYWSSFSSRFASLNWIEFDVLQSLASMFVFALCFVLLLRRGVELRDAWGRSRNWLGDLLAGLLMGGMAYGLYVMTYLLLRGLGLPPGDVGHPQHAREHVSLLAWVMVAGCDFAVAALGRLLVYGVVLARLRVWLRSAVSAGLAVTVLLVLTWSPENGPAEQAAAWVEEIVYCGAFLVTRRVWPIAIAATTARVVPWLIYSL